MAAPLAHLHDATLRAIHVDWTARTCELEFAGAPSSLSPFSITFREVTAISIPMTTPWGPSASVLAARSDGGRHLFEMQSGDVVEITAAHCDARDWQGDQA